MGVKNYLLLFLLLLPSTYAIEVGASPSKIFPDDSFYIINSNEFPLDFEVIAKDLLIEPKTGTISANSKMEIQVKKGDAEPGSHLIRVETRTDHGTIGTLPAIMVRAEIKERVFAPWHLVIISLLIVAITVIIYRRR